MRTLLNLALTAVLLAGLSTALPLVASAQGGCSCPSCACGEPCPCQ